MKYNNEMLFSSEEMGNNAISCNLHKAEGYRAKCNFKKEKGKYQMFLLICGMHDRVLEVNKREQNRK